MSYDNDYDVIHNNDDYYVNQDDESADYWNDIDDIDEEDTDVDNNEDKIWSFFPEDEEDDNIVDEDD